MMNLSEYRKRPASLADYVPWAALIAPGFVLNKDGSTKKESNAPTQLDAYGNWTKLTKWQTDSQGTRPLSVAYRTLSYY